MKSLRLFNFKSIIDKCPYIQKESKKSNSSESFCSLTYLIQHLNLNQSQKIKIGKGLECFLNDLIITDKDWIKIYPLFDFNCQIDELLMNQSTKIIIYSEYKANLALDSQKRTAMYTHCTLIQDKLKNMYPDYTIKTYIVNLRFLDTSDIPKSIMQRFKKYNNLLNITGLNNYLNNFNVKNFSSYNEYIDILEYLCKQKFLK